jgi:hypothetical protein
MLLLLLHPAATLPTNVGLTFRCYLVSPDQMERTVSA